MTDIGGSASSKYEPTAATTDINDAVPKSMYKSMQPFVFAKLKFSFNSN